MDVAMERLCCWRAPGADAWQKSGARIPIEPRPISKLTPSTLTDIHSISFVTSSIVYIHSSLQK